MTVGTCQSAHYKLDQGAGAVYTNPESNESGTFVVGSKVLLSVEESKDYGDVLERHRTRPEYG